MVVISKPGLVRAMILSPIPAVSLVKIPDSEIAVMKIQNEYARNISVDG